MGQIKVTIAKGGKTSVEAIGFTGPTCTTATAALEARLGRKVGQDFKTEYYEAQQAGEQQATAG